MTDMELQMIRALAKIDDELGMPQDGCNSTEKTITAIRLLNAIYKDDQERIKQLEAEATRLSEHATAIRSQRDEFADKLKIARESVLEERSPAATESCGHLAEDGYFLESKEYVAKFGMVPRHCPLYTDPHYIGKTK